MNTARSVWLGWTTLMVAGAGAYYFAKKDINSYRREQELKGIRGTEYLEWWQIVERGEAAKQAAETAETVKPEDIDANKSQTPPRRKRRSHGDKLG